MTLLLKLDANLSERVQALADARKSSVDSVMITAIENYINLAELRSSFVEEALTAQNHYAETGLHLTSSEISGWLETWGMADETDAPACHT